MHSFHLVDVPARVISAAFAARLRGLPHPKGTGREVEQFTGVVPDSLLFEP